MSREAAARREIPASAAILTIVRQKAETLLQEAQAQAETLRQEAWKAGHAEGLEEGRRVAHEQVTRQYQDALDKVQQQQLMQQSQLTAWFHEMEPEIHRLVMEIAGTVLKRQIDTEPALIVSQVRSALDSLSSAAWVRVRVNPVHLPHLASANLESVYALRTERIEYVGDDAITAGGCLLEAPGTRIDATIETQLERLTDAIARVESP